MAALKNWSWLTLLFPLIFIFGTAPALGKDCAALLRNNDLDKAIECLTELIESGNLSRDHLAIAYGNRGIAWKRKKDYDRAIADYNRVLEIKPREAKAYYNRGITWMEKGSYDQAMADFTKAIEINANYLWAYHGRGILFFTQGRFVQASEDFKVSLTINPKDSFGAIWLFLAMERAGKNGQQELHGRKDNLPLSEWPGPVIQFYLGKSSLAEVLSLAINPDPGKQKENLCRAYFYLGQHFLIKGDRNQAVKMFQFSLDTGLGHLIEYHMAKEELKR